MLKGQLASAPSHFWTQPRPGPLVTETGQGRLGRTSSPSVGPPEGALQVRPSVLQSIRLSAGKIGSEDGTRPLLPRAAVSVPMPSARCGGLRSAAPIPHTGLSLKPGGPGSRGTTMPRGLLTCTQECNKNLYINSLFTLNSNTDKTPYKHRK